MVGAAAGAALLALEGQAGDAAMAVAGGSRCRGTFGESQVDCILPPPPLPHPLSVPRTRSGFAAAWASFLEGDPVGLRPRPAAVLAAFNEAAEQESSSWEEFKDRLTIGPFPWYMTLSVTVSAASTCVGCCGRMCCMGMIASALYSGVSSRTGASSSSEPPTPAADEGWFGGWFGGGEEAKKAPEPPPGPAPASGGGGWFGGWGGGAAAGAGGAAAGAGAGAAAAEDAGSEAAGSDEGGGWGLGGDDEDGGGGGGEDGEEGGCQQQ